MQYLMAPLRATGNGYNIKPYFPFIMDRPHVGHGGIDQQSLLTAGDHCLRSSEGDRVTDFDFSKDENVPFFCDEVNFGSFVSPIAVEDRHSILDQEVSGKVLAPQPIFLLDGQAEVKLVIDKINPVFCGKQNLSCFTA